MNMHAPPAGAKSKSNVGPARFGTILMALAIGAALGAFAYRFSAGPWGSSQPVPGSGESVPQLVREGQQIIVPDGSPLRGKLTIDAVALTEVQRNLVLPAVVEADPARLVRVLPPLAGRITQLKVQLGEQVERGQPLVVLDSPDLGTAYADYERAKANLALAIKNRDRLRDLVRTSAIAVRELQQAETDAINAEAERQRAEARLKQIGVDPEAPTRSRTVTISAPVSGSIIDLTVAPGAYWNDATAALMTVADLSTIWVTANVPEKDTAMVAKGQPVEIVFSAYPGEVFKGEVLFVSNVLDPDTRRTKVRINLENPEARFKPGMFASVTFFAPKQTIPMVPTTALFLKDDVSQVFVEVAPWRFESRRVDVGFQQGDEAAIRNGLSAGDRVVTRGGVLLND
jgi:cobalt-zinc-cadmium efflux system membrane fusion protein